MRVRFWSARFTSKVGWAYNAARSRDLHSVGHGDKGLPQRVLGGEGNCPAQDASPSVRSFCSNPSPPLWEWVKPRQPSRRWEKPGSKGLGRHNPTVIQPRAPAVAPKEWTGAAAALWRRMASNLAGGRGAPPPHTVKRLEGSWVSQNMSFQGWMALAAGTPAQSPQAAAIALEQSVANKKQARAVESEKYQQWLTQGQAKGMRPLFRFFDC